MAGYAPAALPPMMGLATIGRNTTRGMINISRGKSIVEVEYMNYTENLTKDKALNREKKITLLNEKEVLGKEFRIYGTAENPLFMEKDVAEWIDYSKDGKGNYNVSAMISSVDEDEKIKIFTNLNNTEVGSFARSPSAVQSNTRRSKGVANLR